MPDPPAPHARSWWTALAIALLALPPALIAVLQLGRLHPDEVFQMLEPAQQVAFGNGQLSWEWKDGLRNWAVPGALGLVLKACGKLGLDDPQLRRAALELPQYALHAAALGAVYRLIARRIGSAAVNRVPRGALALAGVLLVAATAPVLHFAGRTLSESISTPFLLWGLERVDQRGAPSRAYAWAGVLLGLAVVARYGSAAAVAVALLVLVAQWRLRELALVSAGGALVALLLGVLDHYSWGEAFHSLKAYYDFNVGSDRAAKLYGSQPWDFYLLALGQGVAPWVWPSLLLALLRRGPAAGKASSLLLCTAFGYVLVLAYTPHKEERFLYPALVLLAAGVAPVWIGALAALRRELACAALALSLLAGVAVLRFETRFEPRACEQFRLFVKAVRHGDRVLLLHSGGWGTPGNFYAAGHRWRLCVLPSDACTFNVLRSPSFDRIVGWLDEGRERFEHAGFTVIERQAHVTLWARVSSTPRRL